MNRKLLIAAIPAALCVGAALGLSRTGLPLTWTAFIVLSALLLSVLSRELLKKDRDVFSPVFFITFLFFFYLWLPVFDRLVLFKHYPSDALLYQSGLFFMDIGPEDDYLVFKAVLVCAAGALFFYAGYFSDLAGGLINACRLNISPASANLGKVSLSYLLIGAAVTLFLISQAGGFSAFISTHWAKRYDENAYIINNLAVLQRVLFVVGSVALMVYAAEKRSAAVWALWFLSAAAAVSFFVMEGGRRMVLELAISILAVWHYKVRRISLKAVAAAAAALFLLLPLLDVLRSNLWLGYDKVIAAFKDSDKFQLLRMNTEYNGNFGILVNLMDRIPDDMGYVYGLSFLKPLFSVFPRSIWPDKPLPVTQIMAEKLYPQEQGLSVGATAIGEAYLNLGVPAVILTMFLFGVAARALYKHLSEGGANNGPLLVYACMLPMLFEFYRGPVSDAVLMTAIQAVLLLPLIKRLPVKEGCR